MLIPVIGVLFRSLRLRDAQSVPRLEEFQRQLGIKNHRIEFVPGWNVAAALHQFVLGVDRFGRSLGILANDILDNHQITGLSNRVIRFGGNDQSKSLKIGSDIYLAAVIVAY